MATCVESSMKVYTNLSKRKGLFSRPHIKEGDIILEERPLVSSQFSWNKQYNYTSCENCMRSLETAENMGRRLCGDYSVRLPYTIECCESQRRQGQIQKCEGCQELFCCEECLFEAKEKYHHYLCANNKSAAAKNALENTWRGMHYPPERTTVMLILKLIALTMQSDSYDITKKLEEFVSIDEENVDMINRELLGVEHKEKLRQLYELLGEYIPIEKYGKLGTLQDFASFFAMTGMNGQTIGTSSLTNYVHNIDAFDMSESEREAVDEIIDKLYDDIATEVGQFVNCEGIGLYHWRSKCNHSCAPNAEVTFPYNNNTLVLVALEDIPADQEIFISYLNECQRERSCRTRQKLLWENFAYKCTCSECERFANGTSEASSDESEDERMD